MKISIYINQEKTLEWQLTTNESILCSYLISVAGEYWVRNETIDGRKYAWISKNKILKDMPMLTDKVDTVYKLLKSLDKKGVISYCKKGSKDMIALTKKSSEWNFKTSKNISDLYPSDEIECDDSDLDNLGIGLTSENGIVENPNDYIGKANEESDINRTDKKVSLLESSVLESGPSLSPSPSNFLPSDLELYTNGTKEPSPSKPSLPPTPPMAKNGNLSKMRIGVKKVLSKMEDFDELVNSRDLSITDIMNAFSEYWIIGQGRDFNPMNSKGLQSSFRKWIGFSGEDKLKEVESVKSLKNTSKLSLLIDNIKGKTLPNPSQRIDLNAFLEELKEESIIEIAKKYSKNELDGYGVLLTLMQGQKRIDYLSESRKN